MKWSPSKFEAVSNVKHEGKKIHEENLLVKKKILIVWTIFKFVASSTFHVVSV